MIKPGDTKHFGLIYNTLQAPDADQCWLCRVNVPHCQDEHEDAIKFGLKMPTYTETKNPAIKAQRDGRKAIERDLARRVIDAAPASGAGIAECLREVMDELRTHRARRRCDPPESGEDPQPASMHGDPDPMNSEVEIARMEAQRAESEDQYFAARPKADSFGNRSVFRAGFERGFAKREPLTPEQFSDMEAIIEERNRLKDKLAHAEKLIETVPLHRHGPRYEAWTASLETYKGTSPAPAVTNGASHPTATEVGQHDQP